LAVTVCSDASEWDWDERQSWGRGGGVPLHIWTQFKTNVLVFFY